MKFTNQGGENCNYTRNEVSNKINEIKLKAANELWKKIGKTRHSKEIRNRSEINIGTKFIFSFLF